MRHAAASAPVSKASAEFRRAVNGVAPLTQPVAMDHV
jgi:hypothetical protein